MSASARNGNGRLGNLPVEPDVFVGRKGELARIDSLLGRTRLVTLTGPGGVGKSRLALRAADGVRGRFPGGVWLVELSALTDPALVPVAVARALGLADEPTRPALAAAAAQLGGKPVLLVLDTCEHLLPACARVASALLARVPRSRILATSRQPLAVRGEHVLAVGPLPVGDSAAGGDAVALFAARAVAAVPSFTLTDANRPRVAAVCERLDGIPLAVELAAVRLRGMPLERLLAALDARFETLTTKPPTRPARHQALRTAIGWSHELCTPLERLLWARLSVFAGNWDLEAAEFVCHGGPLGAERVMEHLTALADKSIVTREPGGGGPRYRMLDTLREFGALWLAELGEGDDVRRRHRDYYRWLVRRAEAEWLGPGQRAWADHMSAEHANLRLALDTCLADPDPTLGLELAGTLWFFWFAAGHAEEGRAYLARALGRGSGTSAERILAVWAHRLITLTPADLDAAEDVAAEYVRLAAARGLPPAARILPLTGASLAARGESARSAVLHGVPGPGPAGGGGATFFRLTSHAVQAYLLAGQGVPARAVTAAERLSAECDKHGELWMRAWGDYYLGLARLGLGDAESAADCARAALAAKWRVHDRLGTAAAVDLLVCVEAALGRPERAARLLGAAAGLWRRVGVARFGDAEATVFQREQRRRLRGELGDARFGRLLAEGLALDTSETVAFALAEVPEAGP
ncbi:regulator [Streptomyces spectabilis]|uniref:ATP-binding protein n=2 Tax=Streptomyces spectabilis TaxID=68270 RepID=UPI0033D2DAAA